MPPNVDKATEMGIMTENIPRSFSPNVCSSRRFIHLGQKTSLG
jgi:hypothetical protein